MNLIQNKPFQESVTTAVLLAAGKGSRLYPLTQSQPKCLTILNGRSILERLLLSLNENGFKRLIIVTGYLENCIRDFLGNKFDDVKIEYVYSSKYASTNNIYSLWMARKSINESFMLIESDLVFDSTLLKEMTYPDRIAVAKNRSWMNGTTVTKNMFNQVDAFQNGKDSLLQEIIYKTVNIYSFSYSSWCTIAKRLNQYINAGKVNDYYEKVFEDLVDEGDLSLQLVSFEKKPWYEIDTLSDLNAAEKLFSHDKCSTVKYDNAFSDFYRVSALSKQAYQQIN
jgi:choline kinase